ncbi:hypothetical protein GOBAR_DD11840 [Gossypium barbadense]|nr:hypothetical protein GOBAR_DD11840 [Gossypium barbadense]
MPPSPLIRRFLAQKPLPNSDHGEAGKDSTVKYKGTGVRGSGRGVYGGRGASVRRLVTCGGLGCSAGVCFCFRDC